MFKARCSDDYKDEVHHVSSVAQLCCRSIFGNYSNLFLTIMQNYGNSVKYSLKIGNAITWNNRLTEFASIKLNF